MVLRMRMRWCGELGPIDVGPVDEWVEFGGCGGVHVVCGAGAGQCGLDQVQRSGPG